MINMTLQTERLLLRSFEDNDAVAASYNSRQPSVADAMSDMILADEKAALEWIHWINSMTDLVLPWRILAIELKKEKKCIGLIGVIPQRKIQGEVEILFSVVDEYQNKGYATEAAKEVIKWFFDSRENAYLCAIVKNNNIPSQRVIEMLDFNYIEDREILYDNIPTMFKYYQLNLAVKALI